MHRRRSVIPIALAVLACGGPRAEVRDDLPPHPADRVVRVEQDPARVPPAPPPTEAPGPAVSGDSGAAPAGAPVSGTDPRREGMTFDQVITMQSGSTAARTVASRVELLEDMARRDDLGAQGDPVQTSILLPDDEITLNHAKKTWWSQGGRVDRMGKDASGWFFRADFRGLERWERTGEEVVDGHPCEIWEQHRNLPGGSGGGRQAGSEKVWFATDLDGFVMRYRSENMLGMVIVIERRNVVCAPVSVQEFVVPPGYSPRG